MAITVRTIECRDSGDLGSKGVGEDGGCETTFPLCLWHKWEREERRGRFGFIGSGSKF